MSFTPIQEGFSTALTGAVEPTKILIRRDDPDYDADAPEKIYKQKHGVKLDSKNRYTLIVIVISAILFVTIIAIYDIIRNAINGYYADLSLKDPNSHNNEEDIQRTIIANNNELWASIVFASICILSSIIIVPLLVMLL